MDRYITIAKIAKDTALLYRVAACVAQQGIVEADRWAHAYGYLIAAQPGWAAKWDSAVANGIEVPGEDEAVITDGDILAAVQALLAAQPS